jgi:hypothetical protein
MNTHGCECDAEQHEDQRTPLHAACIGSPESDLGALSGAPEPGTAVRCTEPPGSWSRCGECSLPTPVGHSPGDGPDPGRLRRWQPVFREASVGRTSGLR